MERYSEYKDSGVKWLGEIPSHWEVVPLRKYLKINTRRNMPEAQLLSVTREEGVIVRNVESKEENHNYIPDDLSNYKYVQRGQFVINKMKSWQGSYGVSNYDGIVSPAYFVYDLNYPNKDYFNIAIRSKIFSPFFSKYSKGIRVDQWDLTPEALKIIPFLEPPKAEQDAIVRYLDTATSEIDKAIAMQQKMIDLLNERKQIIIQNAVTKGLDENVEMKESGVEWIGRIPKHWEVRRLRFLCDFLTGDKDTINRVDNGTYPFFVRSPQVERINSYSFDGEAILMAGDGVGAGKVFHYYNGKFDYHQRVYNLHNFRHVDGKFLFYYLKQNFKYIIERAEAKSTVDSVRIIMLKDFAVCFPPKSEQQQIVTYLDSEMQRFDSANTNCQRQITLLQERKQIIINEVVTGKVRVS